MRRSFCHHYLFVSEILDFLTHKEGRGRRNCVFQSRLRRGSGLCVCAGEQPTGGGRSLHLLLTQIPIYPPLQNTNEKMYTNHTRIHKQIQTQIQKDGIPRGNDTQVYFWAHIDLGLNWVFLCSAHVKIQPNSQCPAPLIFFAQGKSIF